MVKSLKKFLLLADHSDSEFRPAERGSLPPEPQPRQPVELLRRVQAVGVAVRLPLLAQGLEARRPRALARPGLLPDGPAFADRVEEDGRHPDDPGQEVARRVFV